MRPLLPRAIIAGLLLYGLNLQAQFIWTGTSPTNGNITDGLNWVGGIAPTGSTTLDLTFDTSGAQTNVIFPDFAVRDITLGASRPAYTFLSATFPLVNTLTLNGNLTALAGPLTVFDSSLAIALPTGTHIFDIGGAPTLLAIYGNLSGAGSLLKAGTGSLTLAGTNTYTGGTIVNFGTLTVDTGSINHAGVDLFVGKVGGDNGALAIINGGDVSNKYSYIGNAAGSTGAVTISGVGSSWTHSGDLFVGNSGTGSVALTNGSAVSSPSATYLGWISGSSGTVTVDGAGSIWTNSSRFWVGISGTGSLSITNGGVVSNAGSGDLGGSTTGSGTVTVNGTGSSWTNSGDLTVGNNGTGSLTITSGGAVSNNNGAISYNSGGSGTATVNGAGSSWTNSGYLSVGEGGTGSLTITNGGAVSNTYGYLGLNIGSSGTATVDGVGSTWINTNPFYVGNSGTGSLTLKNSGIVTVNSGAGTVTLGKNSGAAGTLNIGAAAASPAAAGGVVNAAGITTGSGTGTLQFKTTASSGTPYYLTKDGTAGGAAVLVTGPTQLINTAGYTVLTGANTYAGVGLVGTTINGGTLQLTTGGSISHPGADLTTGNFGDFNISSSGSASTNHGFIGYGSSGSGTVTGSGSLWTLADELIVGAFGGGQGNLMISNGGVVSDNKGSISYIGPGTSYLTVDGAGSAWNNVSYIFVGSGGGNARLDIKNGGTAASASGEIGLNTGYGQATINGTGSVWNIGTSLNVGNNGTGFLELDNNGLLNLAGGTGTINLGSLLGIGTLIIGDSEFYVGGGIINAAAVTTGTGTGTVRFNTATTKAAPYYLTKDGTSGGAPVLINGATALTHLYGYNVLTGANTYSGGTTITGGTLVAGNNTALGSGTVAFNGGRLQLAPGITLSNALNLTLGGTLGGSGTFGTAVTAGTNVHLAPGNSPGILSFSNGLTLASGGFLDFEVQTAAGPAGTGYDLVSVSGAVLDITATSISPYTINLISLNAGGTAGAVVDFSSASPYSWTIATSAAGITNFVADRFVINAGSFSNGLGGGSFFVAQLGNNLVLNFTPVPEPSTYALLALGLVSLACRWRRRA